MPDILAAADELDGAKQAGEHGADPAEEYGERVGLVGEGNRAVDAGRPSAG